MPFDSDGYTRFGEESITEDTLFAGPPRRKEKPWLVPTVGSFLPPTSAQKGQWQQRQQLTLPHQEPKAAPPVGYISPQSLQQQQQHHHHYHHYYHHPNRNRRDARCSVGGGKWQQQQQQQQRERGSAEIPAN